MKNKLFHVLVVGGAALLGSQQLVLADESGLDLDDAEQASPIFCTDEVACPLDATTGKHKVKDGFVCCWSTACEDLDAK